MAPDNTYVPREAAATDNTLEPPAKLKLLYESRDGKLCVFEDSEGHLCAVRAARLA